MLTEIVSQSLGLECRPQQWSVLHSNGLLLRNSRLSRNSRLQNIAIDQSESSIQHCSEINDINNIAVCIKNYLTHLNEHCLACYSCLRQGGSNEKRCCSVALWELQDPVLLVLEPYLRLRANPNSLPLALPQVLEWP